MKLNLKLSKMLGILVMVMFILSVVPFALADAKWIDAEGNPIDVAPSVTGVGVAAESAENSAEPSFIAEPSSVSVAAEAGAAKAGVAKADADKETWKAKTEVLKNRQKELKEEIKTAVKEIKENSREMLKERAENAKENYEAQKEKLVQANEKAKSCSADKNSTDCQSKKNELKLGVKNHLENTLQLIESSLMRIKEQIENSKVLSEEDQKAALGNLAVLEEKLNAQKAKIEVLSETSTNEELRAAIKDLKSLWKEVRQANQRLIVQLTNSKLGNMVKKHEEYYNAMKMRIEFLAKKGVDTADLEALAKKFSSQVDDLKEEQKEAEQAWSDVKDREDLDAAKEAQAKVRESMKATKETLKEFLKTFNGLYNPVKGETPENGAPEVSTDKNSAEAVTA